MYPLLTIDLAKLEANMRVITERCRSHSLDVFGVTKVAREIPESGRPLWQVALWAWPIHAWTTSPSQRS